MSDAEVAVETPVDAEATKPTEEAKPAPPKGPVKRYPKPNVEDLKGKVNALEETIAKAKARQDEIRKELDGRRRGGNDTESNEIRKQLQALRNEFQQVLAQKKATREELDHATKARDALRTQVRGMKTKMEYTTVEKIDEQMQRLEMKLQHTSVSIQEEKKILDDIKKLRASRASVASFSTKLDQLNGDDDCKTIVERLREQDAKLTDIKSQEEALRTQLSEIRAKDDAKNVDIPQLTQELGDAKVLVRETVATIRQLRDEHRAKHDQWWAGEQAWREARQKERERRDEEYAAIRAERDAERKQRAKELAGDPFNKEVTLCEQVQGYLSKYMDNKADGDAAAEKAEVKPLDGMAIYTKKRVEDENPYAAVEKKSKKGRKQEKFKAAAESSDKKINHSFDILEAFAKLSVEAPLFTSKVPAAMESVKERLAHYLKRREEVKAKGDDAEEEPAADSAVPSSSGAAPAAKASKAAPKPFELGEPEPTPAEAASGRAPAPTPAAAPAAESGGAWNTGAAAAPAPEAASEAAPAMENGGDAAEGGEGEGVSVGLTHGEDGNVTVELTVGR